jgi:hypothetical protein
MRLNFGKYAYFLPDRLEPEQIIKFCRHYKITLKDFFTKLGHDTEGL